MEEKPWFGCIVWKTNPFLMKEKKWNESGGVPMQTSKIKSAIRYYHEQLYTNKLPHPEEAETHDLPLYSQAGIEI